MANHKSLLQRIIFCSLIISLSALFHVQECMGNEQPYELSWIRQTGSSSQDIPFEGRVDPLGNICLVGETFGSLFGGNLAANKSDMFLTKYDPDGNQLLGRQYGTPEHDGGRAIVFDAVGNAYVTGNTQGSFGGTRKGQNDIFLSKHNTFGELIWVKQVSTYKNDVGYGISMDASNNIFIGGHYNSSSSPRKSRLMKFDSSGKQLWIGSTIFYEDISSVACDTNGNVCATGESSKSGTWDVIVRKTDRNGKLQWERELGTPESEGADEIAVDPSGNVYIAGTTQGTLGEVSIGSRDAFVAKYNPDGGLQWTTQFGTAMSDYCRSLTVDEFGCTYLCGDTYGTLGESNAGGRDVFVTKCDAMGNVLWTQQFGSSDDDFTESICMDDSGNVYVTGSTFGSMEGVNFGHRDLFVAKFSPVPESVTITLLLCGFASLLFWRRRK